MVEYSGGGGGGGSYPARQIDRDTKRILRCPSCGQESNGDEGGGACCARCLTPEGYLTTMIPYTRS